MCAGLRLVPEVLSFPYPIGFDTVQYAVGLVDFGRWLEVRGGSCRLSLS